MNRLLSHVLGCRALVLVLVLALPGPGLAARGNIRNHLLVIRQLLVSTDYERALAQVQVARQEPHGTDEDVTLSLYEGILLYELRRKDEARAAFRSAFLLRPRAELPVEVAPKVEADIDTYRREAEAELKKMPSPPTQPKDVQPLPDARLVDTEEPAPVSLRQRALIPALAGGALLVAGGVSMGVSSSQLNRFNTNDPSITSLADVERIERRGRTWNAVGVGLLGVGAAGLVTAGGMYLFGAPREDGPALGLSTDGTSAILYGRWP